MSWRPGEKVTWGQMSPVPLNHVLTPAQFNQEDKRKTPPITDISISEKLEITTRSEDIESIIFLKKI